MRSLAEVVWLKRAAEQAYFSNREVSRFGGGAKGFPCRSGCGAKTRSPQGLCFLCDPAKQEAKKRQRQAREQLR